MSDESKESAWMAIKNSGRRRAGVVGRGAQRRRLVREMTQIPDLSNFILENLITWDPCVCVDLDLLQHSSGAGLPRLSGAQLMGVGEEPGGPGELAASVSIRDGRVESGVEELLGGDFGECKGPRHPRRVGETSRSCGESKRRRRRKGKGQQPGRREREVVDWGKRGASPKGR